VLGAPHLPHGRGQGAQGGGRDPAGAALGRRAARDLVAARRDAQGRWKLGSTFNGRFVVDIEAKGQPSRWITLRALRALNARAGS